MYACMYLYIYVDFHQLLFITENYKYFLSSNKEFLNYGSIRNNLEPLKRVELLT